MKKSNQIVLLMVVVVSVSSFPGIPDPCETGNHAHPSNCRKFLQCDPSGKVLEVSCPPDTAYSASVKVCVDKYSQWFDDSDCKPEDVVLSPELECAASPDKIFSNPDVCQRYYNCSDKSARGLMAHLDLFEDECPYPDLFDQLTRKCVHYTMANCPSNARVGIAPYDYVKNLCQGSHCESCKSRLPSCRGKTDGFHENPLKLWSPSFVQCVDQRSVSFLHCADFGLNVFSPVEHRCLSGKEHYDILQQTHTNS